MINWR